MNSLQSAHEPLDTNLASLDSIEVSGGFLSLHLAEASTVSDSKFNFKISYSNLWVVDNWRERCEDI